VAIRLVRSFILRSRANGGKYVFSLIRAPWVLIVPILSLSVFEVAGDGRRNIWAGICWVASRPSFPLLLPVPLLPLVILLDWSGVDLDPNPLQSLELTNAKPK
jgi:hypothetical protein